MLDSKVKTFRVQPEGKDGRVFLLGPLSDVIESLVALREKFGESARIVDSGFYGMEPEIEYERQETEEEVKSKEEARRHVNQLQENILALAQTSRNAKMSLKAACEEYHALTGICARQQ